MILYKLYPVMIVSTIAVVLLLIGLNFASVGLPIRLAITIAISLSWTYGLLVSLVATSVLTRSLSVAKTFMYVIFGS